MTCTTVNYSEPDTVTTVTERETASVGASSERTPDTVQWKEAQLWREGVSDSDQTGWDR